MTVHIKYLITSPKLALSIFEQSNFEARPYDLWTGAFILNHSVSNMCSVLGEFLRFHSSH